MSDINQNINLKIILQTDMKKDINRKNFRKQITSWVFWLNLSNL
jgi:uncharacterized membrane protein